VGQQGRGSGRVLVVGGGIAGFAMMRALDQHGIPAVVVDRLPGPPDAGLGLNLPGNAVRALRDLGVGEGLQGRGVPVRRREYRNARNRLLFAVDEAGFWGPDHGSVCALRGDVLDLLRSGVSASGIRWGTSVRALSERERKVEVSFQNADPESYDFVVGADGVHSTVRTGIFEARWAAGGCDVHCRLEVRYDESRRGLLDRLVGPSRNLLTDSGGRGASVRICISHQRRGGGHRSAVVGVDLQRLPRAGT